MKKIYLLLIMVISLLNLVQAQSSANYAFATSTSGTFTDMSTGTTQLVAAAQDDAASAVTNIGFDFWLMGRRYTQFNVTSNGYLALSSTGTSVSATTYAMTVGTTTTPILASCGGDLLTGTAGKIHYKLTGSAPNRILTVEFLNMVIVYNGTSSDGTSQVRLYESTGVVEYVYGSMNRNAQTGLAGNADSLGIGFVTGNTAANNLVSILSAANAAFTTAPLLQQKYAVSSAIANLNSPVEGSRRTYSLTAPVPAAPSGLNFTAVTQIGMTLNWTDNSSTEAVFAIFKSTDGINYTYNSTVTANTTSSVQSGLSANSTYYWRVYAVSEGAVSTVLAGSQATLTAGSITSNGTGGGNWSSTATWAGGIIPALTDNVTIANGDVVTIDVAANAYSLTVGGGTSGTLEYESTTARTLTVATDVTIATGGTFASAASGTVTTHVLTLPGNLINNGTLDLSTNTNTAGAGIIFTGGFNSSFTGSGATTDLFSLSMSKNAVSQIVEMNLSNFSVRGLSATATGALLTSASGTGTLKISGTNTFSGTLWSAAGYTIPATLGFWLNNPNFTVNGQNGSPTVAGQFRVTQGTYNIGTATGNSMGFSAGSIITVEGGAINTTGRFGVGAASTIFTYTQTGGIITVCTIGNASATLGSFDLGTSNAATISVTGGTIVTQLSATGFDYRMQSGTGLTALTGGTLQLGNAASGAAKTFIFRGLLPFNTIITNTSAGHSLTLPATAPATYVYGVQNLTINTGCTFTNLQIGANPEFFVGNVVNNGTFTSTSAGNRIYNSSTGFATTWSGTGTFTAGIPSFEIDNALGVTLNTTNQIPVLRIIVFTGSFTGCGKFTIGNGGTTTGTIQFGNTTTPTNAGVFDAAPTFNLGTGGQVISYLRVTTPRSTGPEINPGRVLFNLTVDDNINPFLTLAGGDLRVSGTFTMTNGDVNLGGSTLTLGTDATSAGTLTLNSTTAKLYNGKFKRWITTTTGNRDFPVGVASTRRNASINYTTGATTGGTLTSEWISTPGGSNGLPLTEGAITVNETSFAGFWRVEAADGLSGGNYTGSFTAAGIPNVNDYTQLVLVKRVNSSSPWTLDGTHVTTTGSNAAPVLSRTGMANFSEFGIGGEQAVNPIPIKVEYFRGTKQNNNHVLDWKVVPVNTTRGTITLERSSDSRNFTGIYSITATAAQMQQAFTYTNTNPLNGINYYRLKLVDDNSVVTYSSIVALTNASKGLEFVSITPNPVTDGKFKMNIASAEKVKMEIIITDVTGRIMVKQTSNIIAGFNAIDMNVSNLANGIYQVYGNTADGRTKVMQFVKQ